MSNDCSGLLQPLAQSSEAAPVNLPSLNYTNQDFDSLKTRLALLVQQRFPTDFGDYFESDLGVMLMEMWAFCADMLSYKADQLSNEVYVGTVAELANAFRIAQSVGFQPTPPLPATCLFSATVTTVLPTDLTIPAGFGFDVGGSGGNIHYEIFPADQLNNPIFGQDIVIPAGSFSNTSIVGVAGTTVTDSFVSSGQVNQVFTLTSTPVLFDSVQVQVDGTSWTEVDFFTDSQPRQEYRTQFDSTWTGFVIFGNGQGGFVPSQGSQITVTYRIGGGSASNIITNAISEQNGFVVPGFLITVPVTFTNYTAGTGGYDGDTIDVIRQKLPAYVQTQGRAVTADDYKQMAELFVTPYSGMIGKATAVLRNAGCAGNVVDLFVLQSNGADVMTANDQLKAELSSYMDTVKMLTVDLCVKDGEIVLVDTTVDLNVPTFFKKFSAEIQAAAQQRIANFFALVNWDYGDQLKASDLVKALADITQVSSIDVAFSTDDPSLGGSLITPQYFQIIRPDTTNVVLNFE